MAISIKVGKVRDKSFNIDRGVTDLLKILSCLAIVMHHYSQYALTNGVESSWLFRAFSSHGGYVGVALFFFLSGYGLSKSNHSHHYGFVEFLKHRLSKVYFPVMLVTLLWCPIYLWLFGSEASPLELLWQAVGGGRLCFFDNVMWFIRVLLCLYLMFGVYSIAKSRASNVASVGVLLCMTVVCFLCVTYWGAFFHAMSIPFFTIGVLIADFDKQLTRYIHNHYIFASLLILIVVLAIPFRSDDIVPHVIINYLIILAIIKLFAHVTISVTGLPKWLSPQSFNVYLVHNKVLMVGNALMPVVNFVVYIGVVIAVTALFSIVRKILQISI